MRAAGMSHSRVDSINLRQNVVNARPEFDGRRTGHQSACVPHERQEMRCVHVRTFIRSACAPAFEEEHATVVIRIVQQLNAQAVRFGVDDGRDQGAKRMLH